MSFPKSYVFSFKPTTSFRYPPQRGELNCVDISKDFTTACRWNIKKIIIIIIKIYIVKKTTVFLMQCFKYFLKRNENQN